MGAKKSSKSKEPWDKPNPKEKSGTKTHHMDSSEKASAKRSAKKAGRARPSLVDNMNAISKGKKQ